MIFINDIAASQHAHEEGEAEALEQFTHEKVKELTSKGGEFYPYTKEHWDHATGELSDSLSGFMAELAQQESHELLGRVLASHVKAFWESQAYLYVERMIENKENDYE